MSIGEELDSIDIGLMSGEGLHGFSGSDIPQLGESIAGTGDEGVLVRWIYADAHDVSQVVRELRYLGACLQIPFHTGHIARGRQDGAVIDESTAGEVSRVPRQLSCDTGGPITVGVEVVDGADVIQPTAGNVVTTRSIRAGHDPRGSEGDGVHLVGGVSVPDDELSIL